MSVAWPGNASEAKVIIAPEFWAQGPVSGEDSDMNVQATGVALAPRRVKLQGREHLIKEIVADFCSLKKEPLATW